MASPPGSQPTTRWRSGSFVDDGAAGHDVAAQDEEQHHHQGEIVHGAEQARASTKRGRSVKSTKPITE